MICFEKFINNKLSKYDLTFNDFLREIDDTQEKPSVFYDYWYEIINCKDIEQLRILLEKCYFSEVGPCDWIILFFDFAKDFTHPKFYKPGIFFWYDLSAEWSSLVSKKLKEDPSIIIKPYCSEEKKLIKNVKFKKVKL